MKNGWLDLSDFLHEVRGPKSKFGSTAGFLKKNLNFALFGFLWSKLPKIALCENLAHWILLISHIYIDLINIYNFSIDTKCWKNHPELLEAILCQQFWLFSIFFGQIDFFRFWVIGSVRYRILCKYKMVRSICKRPQVQIFF